MALYHVATLTPTKAELIADWVPNQSWCPPTEQPVEVIGAYRFDDPEARVGMEAFLVKADDTVLHVPLTYRDEPLAGASDALIGKMHHSALGTRWVYDGLGDPRFVVMLTAVSMTGQGEALGMVQREGRWYIAPTNVRIRGGGWTQQRVPVDGFEESRNDQASVTFGNDGFELTVFRHPAPGAQPAIGLTAVWDGLPNPVILAEVRERAA